MALEFSQRSWQHEHGLPAGDRVYAIAQGGDGYLWVATQYGLARFDGRTFTVFDHVNTPQLGSDDCRTLAEDEERNLWIGTRDGLIRKSGTAFISFKGKLGRQAMSYPPLCASRGGGVWVGASGAVCRIRGESVEVYGQEGASPVWGGTATCLDEDEHGSLWIGTKEGLVRLDIPRRRFEIPEQPTEFAKRPVTGMCRGRDGVRWILSIARLGKVAEPAPATLLARLDPGQWPKPPTLCEQWSGPNWTGRSVTADREGTLWITGAQGGVLRYRNGETQLLSLPYRGEDAVTLTSFVDREENLWVGTSRNGLYRCAPKKFSAYTTRDGLAHNNVWSISQCRDGSVLVGTDGGVTQIQGSQSKILKGPDGSAHKAVRAVAEDTEGAIWVGTMRSLECIRQGVSAPVAFPGEWFEAKIRALYPGRDGAMWIGTVRGLTRLHKHEITKYTTVDGLGSDEVRAVLEDREGDIWAGTLGGGLSRLHQGRFTTLTTTNGLSSNNVWALHGDSEGVLWIGTDNGLSACRNGQITTFTKAEGLPDSLANFILSDAFGRLWVGHDRGIYAVEKQQLWEVARKTRSAVLAVTFDESDGLLSIETNGQKSNPSACVMRNGKLWFPTTQGVAILDPAKVSRRRVPPLAAVEEVRANGKQVLGSGTEGRAARDPTVEPRDSVLRLPPGGARVLEFHYTANTFVAPEKASFKYRLGGAGQWIEAGTRRQAYFTDLRPGDYQFEVKAGNHNGVWQEAGAVLPFHVAPFYYQTWWFYVSCGACVALLAGVAIGWRARELRRIYLLEQTNALNEQRKQIARDIHDELGSSLTHIIRLSDGVRHSATRPENPALQAERIAAIAGEAVDNIGEIVWANNPDYDTLEDLAAYLREHAAVFFADSGITAHLDFPERIPSRAVSGVFRRHLVLLLKEALQNVSKHAEARRVSVRMTLCNGQIELSVADDGRGLPVDGARRFGNGLTNMRQRVSELKGTFELSSAPGEGTAIRVIVPLPEA